MNVLALEPLRGNFGNQWYWPRVPHESDDAVQHNRQLVDRFLGGLHMQADDGHPDRRDHHKHRVAVNVPLFNVYEGLLASLRWANPVDSQPFTGILLQLAEVLQDAQDTTCAVYLMSCGVVRERALDDSGARIKQLFQGAYPDRHGDIYPGDRQIRVARGLTVQVHNIAVLNDNRNVIAENVPVVALWVPREYAKAWAVQNQEDVPS